MFWLLVLALLLLLPAVSCHTGLQPRVVGAVAVGSVWSESTSPALPYHLSHGQYTSRLPMAGRIS